MKPREASFPWKGNVQNSCLSYQKLLDNIGWGIHLLSHFENNRSHLMISVEHAEKRKHMRDPKKNTRNKMTYFRLRCGKPDGQMQ